MWTYFWKTKNCLLETTKFKNLIETPPLILFFSEPWRWFFLGLVVSSGDFCRIQRYEAYVSHILTAFLANLAIFVNLYSWPRDSIRCVSPKVTLYNVCSYNKDLNTLYIIVPVICAELGLDPCSRASKTFSEKIFTTNGDSEILLSDYSCNFES